MAQSVKAVNTMNETDKAVKNQVVSREVFDDLCDQFPNVPQASYQAGTGEYFVVEYGANGPARLVHYFNPIL